MSTVLSQESVLGHLKQRYVCADELTVKQIESKSAKNFNLLVTLSDQQSLLVKQEPYRLDGTCKGDLQHESRLHQLLQQGEWAQLCQAMSELIDFDASSGIAVFRYFKDYSDLSEFYETTPVFPVQIAAALGKTLAQIHASTLDCAAIETLFGASQDPTADTADLEEDWGMITPDCLSEISTAGLKFYQLYQRYESLGHAITQLNQKTEPCCLIHNDLKLNNILLNCEWSGIHQKSSGQAPMVRLIDWEKWEWGDPAADLGALVASYLKLWLQSLLVSAGMELELSLRLCERPLEALQPSLIVLVQSYLQQFPAVVQRFPNFLERVMQFAGLALIESIQAGLHYYEPFGNREICMLQVAKTLLCEPIAACQTILGKALDVTEHLDSEYIDPEYLDHSQLEDDQLPATFQEAVELPCMPRLSDPVSTPMRNRTMAEQIADIAQNLQIDSVSQIAHCDYEPLHLPDSISAQYQQLSPALQRQHLSCQLCNYLYRIYWSGEQERCSELEKPEQSVDEPIKNDQYRGIQLDFYHQLDQANKGIGYLDPNWQIQNLNRQGWLVQKQGLKLLIPPNLAPQSAPHKGDSISVHLPKNRIDDRYYVAVGNAGIIGLGLVEHNLESPSKTLQICLNLTTDGVIKAMRCLTKALNELEIPFILKARFDPTEYNYWNTGILEFARSHYKQVQPILQQFYQAEKPQFRAITPLFMKPLAAGLGLAEQPAGLSFGMQRCQIVAEALIDCWEQKITTPAAKVKAIQQAFEQQGLDWQHPYLEPDSSDHYPF